MTDWKPTARRAAEVLLVVALVAAVLPFVVYAAPSLVGGEDSYVVRSGSMEPAIHTGDVVVVADARPADIETGDVITFTPDGQGPPTTHRVVSIRENDGVTYFRTKGDANAAPDAEPVVENELVGKVTLVLPYVGYVISFAGTTAGFLTLVAAPFGLLLATEVWSVFRERDDGDEGGGEAAPDAPPTVAAANDDPAFTLSPTDMRLSIVVLLALAGYSSFMAVRRPTPVSIAVAVGAFGTTVYLTAMRYTAATAGTTAPERPTAALPPAREVPAAERDGRGLGPVAAGDGPGANGALGVSLAVSSATWAPDGPEPAAGEAVREGPEPAAGEAVTVELEPIDGMAEEDGDDDASTATDESSADEPPTNEASPDEPSEQSTDGADDPGPEGADASTSEEPRLREPFTAVVEPVYRFLYAVGYAEVAAVRAVLRRLGLRGTDNGGED